MIKFINLFCFLLILITPTSSQQHYDKSNCTSEMQYPSSNYLCNAEKSSCETFIIYRAKEGYQTLTSISYLFNTNTSHLLMYNNINMSQTDPDNLQPGREIIVPVTCSCLDRFSEALFTYNASKEQSLSAIACEVFEGLVKGQTLAYNNQEFLKEDKNFDLVKVPVKCACVDTFETINGVNFLVAYPVITTDSTDLIARKFGVPQEMILSANGLGHFDAIFPQTTLLIPTKNVPVLNLDVSSSPPSGNLRPEVPPDNHIPVENLKYLKVILWVAIFLTVLLIFIVSGVLILARKKIDCERFDASSGRTSKFSDLSPDFLDNISKFKHTLTCYRMDELRVATKDFNESLGCKVYHGRIGNADMAIEQIDSMEEANHVISILTKINHINIVKLEGCCFESNQYLVYEFVDNGSLRNCLSNPTVAKQLTWDRRVQIAFDIAEGLHYIHSCTRPSYIHNNINIKTILITENYRAKISGFRNAKYGSCSEEKKGTGTDDTAVDVYAFGFLVVELLSGDQVVLLKNFLRMLGDKELQESPKNLEKLKTLMDPVMEKDYSLEAAVFLACLAKACLEEDPLERPSMNDVVKALSKTL